MRNPNSTTSGVRPLGRRSFVDFVAFGCLLVMGFVQSASAMNLTAWDFAGKVGNESSVNATTTVTPAFQMTQITRGGTQDLTPFPGSFFNGSWPFDSNPDGYFQFSINPAPGTTYSITDIDFNIVTMAFGPNTWALRSDADGYAADLDFWVAFPGLTPPTYSTRNSVLPATSDFQNLTGLRTFRLFGLNSSGGGGGLAGVDNDVAINGTFTMGQTVPETLPFGVFGLTAAALFWVRSRIKP